MNLSNNFTLEQLTASGVALKKGIPNVPNDEQKSNLTELAQALEGVQLLLGKIYIDSAFRSPKLNSAVGGSTTSAHLQGYAADFVCPSFGSPKEICEALTGSGVHFDQLIQEGTWVHISIDPRMRGEVLTAHFSDGRVSYTQGLA